MTDQFSIDFEATLTRDRERLSGLAIELALREGPDGITVSDLREEAQRVGILTGHESAERIKALNLGALMKRAGLCCTDRIRRSRIKDSHGNRHSVWTHQRFAGAA